MCWRWNRQQNWSQRAGCQASRWKQPGQTDKHGQRSVRWQGTGCRSYLQLLWLRGQEDTLGSGGDTKVCSRRRSKKEVGEPVRAVLQKAWAGVRTAGLLPAYRQRTATERDTVLHHEAAAAGGDNDKHKVVRRVRKSASQGGQGRLGGYFPKPNREVLMPLFWKCNHCAVAFPDIPATHTRICLT